MRHPRHFLGWKTLPDQPGICSCVLYVFIAISCSGRDNYAFTVTQASVVLELYLSVSGELKVPYHTKSTMSSVYYLAGDARGIKV